MNPTLLNKILLDQCGQKPFAILGRNCNKGILEVVSGRIINFETVGDIPLPHSFHNDCDSVLILLPFKQISERGFSCVNDHTPLLAMMIEERETIYISDFIQMIPDKFVDISEGYFDIDDERYAEMVQRIIKDEIGNGSGSNFVLKRKFVAVIPEYTLQKSLAIYRRLLQNETGAYWTFLVHTGKETLVGASPELHVKLQDGIATMNPVSGTYRYPSSGPTLEGVSNFLASSKEAEELYMVVEEELKMIGSFCPQGGKITGPFLKEMSCLAHTEYLVQGKTLEDPRKILCNTMFSPAITGSPLENACRVIAKYEPEGRGYYAGVAALISLDVAGSYTLDSTILIRTACIDGYGHAQISVGATIVRHSDPIAEADETRSKVNALLDAMQDIKRAENVRKSS